jgi:hypothetical protein
MTIVDLATWRALIFQVEPDQARIEKAVFEVGDKDLLTARAVSWHYPMRPQPAALDPMTILMPPGYPLMLHMDEQGINWVDFRIYHEPNASVIMVRPRESPNAPFSVLGVDSAGAPTVQILAQEPPLYAQSKAVLSCFDGERSDKSAVVYSFLMKDGRLKITGGKCVWQINADQADIVMTSQGSARLEARGDQPLGKTTFRFSIFLLILAASVLTRAIFLRSTWISADITTTLFVFLVSLVTPLWILLWGFKSAIGCITACLILIRFMLMSPKRWRYLAATALVGCIAAFFFRPLAWIDWYTNKNADDTIAAMGSTDDRQDETFVSSTTHLIVGYSTVNGAAAGRGAYGSSALDQIMRTRCGAGKTFGRHAVDGGNICLLAPKWNSIADNLDQLEHRLFFGGFNDDMTPSLKSLKTLMPTIVALVPVGDPYPNMEDMWRRSSMSNLQDASVGRQSANCIQSVIDHRKPSPFTFVYDLGVFDLGHPRLYGREQWTTQRREVVEREGGTFVDMRDLIPGESLLYFNDFVHPSEIGYRALGDELCKRLEKNNPVKNDTDSTKPSDAR